MVVYSVKTEFADNRIVILSSLIDLRNLELQRPVQSLVVTRPKDLLFYITVKNIDGSHTYMVAGEE